MLAVWSTLALAGSLPTLESAPPVTYPPDALAVGLAASVLLRLTVDEAGRVAAAEVVESAGADFDRAARQAALSLRFDPARDDEGLAVPAELLYRQAFDPADAAAVSATGTVRAGGTRIPLDGVEVVFERAAERLVGLTDEDGGFAVAGLAAGTWVVHTERPGFAEERVEVSIAADRIAEIAFALVEDRPWEAASDEVTVYGDRVGAEVAERRLTQEEVRYFPGTGGDVVKVVQNLPGVARAPLGVGQLVVRGTAPEDTVYFVDGGQIPAVFHFSGLSTVVSGQLVDEVVFLPGSYGVRYGRALGGVVDLRLSSELPDRSRGVASVDLLQASAFVEHRFARSALSVSARRSYVDAILTPVLSGGGTDVRAPRYADVQARYRGEVGAGTLDALLLGSTDAFRVVGRDPDGEPTVAIGLTNAFARLFVRHRGRAGAWRHEAQVTVGPDEQTFAFEGDGAAYERGLGGAARVEGMRPAPQSGTGFGARLGLDVQAGRFAYRYDVPGFGAPEAAVVGRLLPAAYAEATARTGPWELAQGVRADAGLVGPWRAGGVDPRTSVRFDATPSTRLHGAVGGYSQPPTVRQLVAAPVLGWQRSLQVSVGAEQAWSDWTFGVTGWHAWLGGLVSGREDAFRFFSGPPPAGPLDDGPWAGVGTGRTYGLEASARLRGPRTAALGSLTLGRSTRTDRPGDPEAPFVYDQPAVLVFLVSRQLPRRWRVGVRARYTSGTPYTPVVNRYVDLPSRAFVPVYASGEGGSRLPAFASLDARVDKDWVFRTWTFTTYLDLQNATNRRNVEVMAWSDDYSREEPLTGLPLVPAFGLQGSW